MALALTVLVAGCEAEDAPPAALGFDEDGPTGVRPDRTGAVADTGIRTDGPTETGDSGDETGDTPDVVVGDDALGGGDPPDVIGPMEDAGPELDVAVLQDAVGPQDVEPNQELPAPPDAQPVLDALEPGEDIADVADPDPDVAPDTTVEPDTSVEPDPDVALDTSVEPDVDTPTPSCPLAAVEALCEPTCALIDACGSTILGPDCQAGCLAAASYTADFEANLTCVLLAGGSLDAPSCEVLAGCMQPASSEVDDCDGVCGLLEGCADAPDTIFGSTQCECRAACGALGLMLGTGQAVLASCMYGVLSEGCNPAAGVLCSYQLQQPGICESMCGAIEGCDGFPSTYPDFGTCYAACSGFGAPQLIASATCASILAQEDGSCLDPVGCASPPDEPLAGSHAFCDSVEALCGATEAINLPSPIEVCAWVVTGVAMPWAGADLQDAAGCVDELTSCPPLEESNAVFSCLAAWEPCDPYCGKLSDCGWLEASGIGVGECTQQCQFSHLVDPEVTVEAVECVDAADGCEAMLTCF